MSDLPARSNPTSSGINSTPLREIALLFLRLGFVAFGGPAAHIAMMEEQFVQRHRWITREQFLDILATVNLIPGPSSTEMAIYIGYRQAGINGLLIAGLCFILPAAIIVGAIAWLYVHYGRLPEVRSVLYGIKPVVIAVILDALWRLGQTAISRKGLLLLAVAAFTLALFSVMPVIELIGCGALAGTAAWRRQARESRRARPLVSLWLVSACAIAVPVALTLLQTQQSPREPVSRVALPLLFLFFVKIGAILFGSGYTLLAFLRSDLVIRWHWLTNAQLLDAVAVGQVTPGPVFTTATFIGFVLGGLPGAIISTVGIFLPSFFYVALSSRILPKLRQSPIASGFMDGVTAASLALMAAVMVQLARAALIDPITICLALASALALLRFRINSAWLILAGGIVGLVVR